jgi:hypothetical protein
MIFSGSGPGFSNSSGVGSVHFYIYISVFWPLRIKMVPGTLEKLQHLYGLKNLFSPDVVCHFSLVF